MEEGIMYKDILLPIDLGQESSWQKALPLTIELCKNFGARLHIMTVVPDYSFHYVSQYFPAGYEEKMIAAAEERLRDFVSEHVAENVQVQLIVAHGSIYRQVAKAAEEIGADLIIMASHTPDATDFLMGPNAEKVLHHFKRSVLIVRE
jgi:nucleotide-binding universal stress UspA family protein